MASIAEQINQQFERFASSSLKAQVQKEMSNVAVFDFEALERERGIYEGAIYAPGEYLFNTGLSLPDFHNYKVSQFSKEHLPYGSWESPHKLQKAIFERFEHQRSTHPFFKANPSLKVINRQVTSPNKFAKILIGQGENFQSRPRHYVAKNLPYDTSRLLEAADEATLGPLLEKHAWLRADRANKVPERMFSSPGSASLAQEYKRLQAEIKQASHTVKFKNTPENTEAYLKKWSSVYDIWRKSIREDVGDVRGVMDIEDLQRSVLAKAQLHNYLPRDTNVFTGTAMDYWRSVMAEGYPLWKNVTHSAALDTAIETHIALESTIKLGALFDDPNSKDLLKRTFTRFQSGKQNIEQHIVKEKAWQAITEPRTVDIHRDRAPKFTKMVSPNGEITFNRISVHRDIASDSSGAIKMLEDYYLGKGRSLQAKQVREHYNRLQEEISNKVTRGFSRQEAIDQISLRMMAEKKLAYTASDEIVASTYRQTSKLGKVFQGKLNWKHGAATVGAAALIGIGYNIFGGLHSGAGEKSRWNEGFDEFGSGWRGLFASQRSGFWRSFKAGAKSLDLSIKRKSNSLASAIFGQQFAAFEGEGIGGQILFSTAKRKEILSSLAKTNSWKAISFGSQKEDQTLLNKLVLGHELFEAHHSQLRIPAKIRRDEIYRKWRANLQLKVGSAVTRAVGKKLNSGVDLDSALEWAKNINLKWESKVPIYRSEQFGSHVSPGVIADEALLAKSLGNRAFEIMKAFRGAEKELNAGSTKYFKQVEQIYSNVEKKWPQLAKKFGITEIEGLHPGAGPLSWTQNGIASGIPGQRGFEHFGSGAILKRILVAKNSPIGLRKWFQIIKTMHTGAQRQVGKELGASLGRNVSRWGDVGRLFKLPVKGSVHLAKETGAWLNKHWIPALKKGAPAAVALAAIGLFDVGHAGLGVWERSPGTVLGALGTFMGSKYLYMGYHYRHPIANFIREHGIRKVLVETGKHMTDAIGGGISIASSYIHYGIKPKQILSQAETLFKDVDQFNLAKEQLGNMISNPPSEIPNLEDVVKNLGEGLHPGAKGSGSKSVWKEGMTHFGSGLRPLFGLMHDAALEAGEQYYKTVYLRGHISSKDTPRDPHPEIEPSYNTAKDISLYKMYRASKIGLSEDEMYKEMVMQPKPVSPYVQASAQVGTALHQYLQGLWYKKGVISGAEQLVGGPEYGVSGHIDAITNAQNIIDIKTLSAGRWKKLKQMGHPYPAHEHQVGLYQGLTSNTNTAYLAYIAQEDPNKQIFYPVKWDPQRFQADMEKLHTVQGMVEKDLEQGILDPSNLPKTASYERLMRDAENSQTELEYNAEHLDENYQIYRDELDYMNQIPRGMPQDLQQLRKERERKRFMNSTVGLVQQMNKDRVKHYLY